MLATPTKRQTLFQRIGDHWILYLFLFPMVLYIAVLHYWPMYGIQIAFKNFTLAKGVIGSPWVGMKWFRYFFESKLFLPLITNTLSISLYSLIAGFPMPILLALMLHYVRVVPFKKVMQTATYLPHFISTVVMVGMLSVFMSPRSGFVNTLLRMFGGQGIYFFGDPQYFRHLYVWSGVWQGAGWGSIIYMAALTNISPELHEAAVIDGANMLRRIWHIDLPGILPTMIILLIINSGNIMSVGFEKIYLMQNDLNLAVSEVISTYTYKIGMMNQKWSYSAAIGLFNNAINFAILTLVNFVAKRISGYSLW